MKVLIDIAEEEYLMIKTKIITGDDGYLDRAVADGIQIPDNATNADVIRTLFPDGIPKDIVWTLQGDKGADWWNAPYQKGGKYYTEPS